MMSVVPLHHMPYVVPRQRSNLADSTPGRGAEGAEEAEAFAEELDRIRDALNREEPRDAWES